MIDLGPRSRGPYATIFKWNGARFLLHTRLKTDGRAYGLRFLMADNTIFLAAARWQAQSSFIFKWNGTAFNRFQELPSSGVSNLSSFIMFSLSKGVLIGWLLRVLFRQKLYNKKEMSWKK